MTAPTRPSVPAGAVVPAPRRPALLVAAAVLVVAVTGAVLLFAVPRPPPLDPLPAGATEGRVAWSSWAGDGPCVHVLHPDGERDRWCEVGLSGTPVVWRDGSLLLADDQGMGTGLVVLDPATGEVERRPLRPDEEDLRPLIEEPWLLHDRGATDVATSRRDGRLTVRVDEVVVWEVDAHPDYTVREVRRSADGSTLLLLDAAGRLLVAPTDGSAPPRVWATDVPAWTDLAWEAGPPLG